MDPVEHCRHCFAPLPDWRYRVCPQCRASPRLRIARAFVFEREAPLLAHCKPAQLAGFMAYQWVQLDWPIPDAIITLSDDASIELGQAIAPLLCRPWIAIAKIEIPDLELLLIDAISPLDHIRKDVRDALEAFPKRILQLSLSQYDFSPSLD